MGTVAEAEISVWHGHQHPNQILRLRVPAGHSAQDDNLKGHADEWVVEPYGPISGAGWMEGHSSFLIPDSYFDPHGCIEYCGAKPCNIDIMNGDDTDRRSWIPVVAVFSSDLLSVFPDSPPPEALPREDP